MDINSVSQLISNLGFPVAAYVGLFWYMQKMENAHREEIEHLSEALNNNTQAIAVLSERLTK